MKTTNRHLTVRRLTAAVFLLTVFALQAANWPQWRGPNGNGVAEPGEYPIEFSPEKNVIWKAVLPGKGCSTPVIWEDRIFLTCTIGGKNGVLCFDRKGKELWRATFGPAASGKHKSGSGSNPSVATDGERVFVHYKTGIFACVDFSGKVVWEKDLQKLYGKISLLWDLGTSPIRAGKNIILGVMNAGPSYLLCVDGATGKVVWKQERKFECAYECDETYSTPVLAKVGDREIIVSWAADRAMGHDVKTGAPIWECNLNPEKTRQWRTISSPVVADGMALISYGRGNKLAGIKIDGKGKVKPVWTRDRLGSDTPTPATHDGKAYILHDKGALTCIDIQTGKDIWATRMPKGRAPFFASPVLVGNRLYCLRNNGELFVGEVSDKGFKVLAKNMMNEHMVATPVFVDNRIYLRGDKHLYCIGK